jgi:hypothetical protein
MKTYLNIETGRLTAQGGATQPLRRLDAKRGDTLEIEVVPSATLAASATGKFVAKPKGAFSSIHPILYGEWSAPAASGSGWRFSIETDTEELAALLPNETAEVTLMAEITWSVEGKTRSTQTMDLVVAQKVWRGNEVSPTPAPALPRPVVQYLADAPAHQTDFFMFPGGLPPASGLYQAATDTHIYTFQGGWTQWKRAAIATW